MNRNISIRLAITALFVISLILPFIPQNVFADSAWYSTNWSYRKTITVNGTVAGAQTSYQFPFIIEYGSGTDTAITYQGIPTWRIYCNSKCQANFNDIRFINSTNTLLDFYIESYTASTNATVWVELDSIQAAPNQTAFYMYYGNLAVTSSTSNGTATFLFFDDFETGSFSRWTFAGANWTINSTYKYGGLYSAMGYNLGVTYLQKTVSIPNTFRVHLLFSANSTLNAAVPMAIGQSGSTKLTITESAGILGYFLYYDTTYHYFPTANLTYVSGTWYELVSYHNTNNTTSSGNYYDMYAYSNNVTSGIDGNTLTYGGRVTSVYDNTGNAPTSFNVRDATCSGSAIYVDNIYISKWNPQPPVIATIGSETGLGNLPTIQDVKVFETFKNSGDWLIVMRYLNTFTPYYDTYDVKQYFVIRMLNLAGTEIARTSVPVWGNKVGCVYLAASQVTALNWGSAYTVQIYGTFTGNPYTAYTLTSTDWIGTDLTLLDSWVITSAGVIGTYYSTTLTTNISTRGEVLNSDGASVFNLGIPGLMIVRPNLFQISSIAGTGKTTTYVQTNRSSDWQSKVGPKATSLLTNMGSFINVDGRTIGVILCIILMVILAAFCLAPNHTMASNALTVPILAIGIGLLLFDQALIAVIFLLASVIVLWQVVLNKGG